jgi:hypothetical protein
MTPHDHPSTPDAIIPCRLHPSNFKLSDANFYCLSGAGDGNVYYTLSSHNIDAAGRFFRYEPRTGKISLQQDLGAIFGEDKTKTIPQGKSHSPFFQRGGKLYGATHYGFMKPDQVKEEPGVLPAGYLPYPGGHFFSHDLQSGAFEDLARAPEGQGIITMAMDVKRGRMYGLTWPGGLFLSYDLATREFRNLGPQCRDGEVGEGENYMCLCRVIVVVPETGAAYFTLPNGQVKCYDPATQTIRILEKANLKIDIFGQWDHREPGHQGYNWRQAFWHERMKRIIALQPRTAWLYAFDPTTEKVEVLDRICALDLKKSGRLDPYRYSYLSLQPGLDGETVYYLTGDYGLIAGDGRRVKETVHLITYHLPTGTYRDHGRLRLEDGRYPRMANSLLVHTDGRLYSCPWIEKPGPREKGDRVEEQVDLISFANPLS